MLFGKYCINSLLRCKQGSAMQGYNTYQPRLFSCVNSLSNDKPVILATFSIESLSGSIAW